MTSSNMQPTGMRAFFVVWAGQVVSLLGSAMTAFALTIWAYQETGQVTTLALVAFFSFGPAVLLSPVAGALVDRWNRKLVMMISDLAAGLSTIVIFVLLMNDSLEVWQLYVAGAFSGIFQAFQFPAYSAAVTMMLPKEQYARASGMLSLAQSASGVLAPMLAGAILAFSNLATVLMFDILTFIVAVLALLIVHIPQPEQTAAGREGSGSLWQESLYGFRYIWQRRPLLGLQLVFTALNFIAAFTFVLLPPMVLARTGGSEIALGTVQSVGAAGGVVGGLLLSIWGGPKRRVLGVILSMIGVTWLGQPLLAIGRGLFIWCLGAFVIFFLIPLLNGSNQAIWQAKVAPDVQGRVFSVRRLIAQITFPIATLLAGPLADRLFEPAMATGGPLADFFGRLVGTGPGSGMALIIFLTGLIGGLIAAGAYLSPSVRNVETLLPDYDVSVDVPMPMPATATAAEAAA